MSRTVHLLGRPRIEGGPGEHAMRSRKSWALLAYLLLSERPPTRTALAGLLFEEADDPLGALRWGLADVRRALGGGAALAGDPVVLQLEPGTVVDVQVLARGRWADAVLLPGLGSPLLEGLTVRGAVAFESWLLSEQRRLAAASEEILHEAAVASLSRGAYDVATGYAVRLVAMTPLDENHHALLIRLYRLAGDREAAQRQFATCSELLREQLGTRPGPAVRTALRESVPSADGASDEAAIEAVLESGRAAVSAGALETGADVLRSAVRLADRGQSADLRVSSRLVLAETLIHALRGLDEEGLEALQGADDIALARGDRPAVAEARCEIGYVDLLRARYDRAEVWLSQALAFADEAPLVAAKAAAYLGVALCDQGRYAAAQQLLEQAAVRARAAGDLRRAAFSLANLGRLHLLRGDLGVAAARLRGALELTQREHWLSYLPWPQALLGEVELARGDVPAAAALLEQAFARACQLGDPCWEGLSTRGLALLAEERGQTDLAFDLLGSAHRRATRVADSYVWLEGHILDAQCLLGRRHDHPGTAGWAEALTLLGSRTGMRELAVRGLLHSAALGRPGHARTARLLAAEIDNPALVPLLDRADDVPATPTARLVPPPRRPRPAARHPGSTRG